MAGAWGSLPRAHRAAHGRSCPRSERPSQGCMLGVCRDNKGSGPCSPEAGNRRLGPSTRGLLRGGSPAPAGHHSTKQAFTMPAADPSAGPRGSNAHLPAHQPSVQAITEPEMGSSSRFCWVFPRGQRFLTHFRAGAVAGRSRGLRSSGR